MSSIYEQLGEACRQFGKNAGEALKEINYLIATSNKKENGMSDQMLNTMASALGYLVLVVIAIVILFGGFFVVMLICLGIKGVIKDLMDGEDEE